MGSSEGESGEQSIRGAHTFVDGNRCESAMVVGGCSCGGREDSMEEYERVCAIQDVRQVDDEHLDVRLWVWLEIKSERKSEPRILSIWRYKGE